MKMDDLNPDGLAALTTVMTECIAGVEDADAAVGAMNSILRGVRQSLEAISEPAESLGDPFHAFAVAVRASQARDVATKKLTQLVDALSQSLVRSKPAHCSYLN